MSDRSADSDPTCLRHLRRQSNRDRERNERIRIGIRISLAILWHRLICARAHLLACFPSPSDIEWELLCDHREAIPLRIAACIKPSLRMQTRQIHLASGPDDRLIAPQTRSLRSCYMHIILFIVQRSWEKHRMSQKQPISLADSRKVDWIDVTFVISDLKRL